jgi:hypothetical protein
MNRLLKINKSTYFWTLCVICILFIFLTKQFVYTDQIYYSSLGEQFTSEQIQRILAYQNETWRQVLAYCLIPLIIIIRVLYTSFCLYIGDLVEETHWGFKPLFNISLKADVAFSLNTIFSFYYCLLSDIKTLDDLSVNYLSLLKIVGKENIPDWLVLAFNSINVFELLYVILLIVMLKTSFRITYLKSIIFVLLTYCIGNYFYLTAMTFLYLSFS